MPCPCLLLVYVPRKQISQISNPSVFPCSRADKNMLQGICLCLRISVSNVLTEDTGLNIVFVRRTNTIFRAVTIPRTKWGGYSDAIIPPPLIPPHVHWMLYVLSILRVWLYTMLLVFCLYGPRSLLSLHAFVLLAIPCLIEQGACIDNIQKKRAKHFCFALSQVGMTRLELATSRPPDFNHKKH